MRRHCQLALNASPVRLNIMRDCAHRQLTRKGDNLADLGQKAQMGSMQIAGWITSGALARYAFDPVILKSPTHTKQRKLNGL